MDTTLAYGLLLALMNGVICLCLPAVLLGMKQKRTQVQVNNTPAVEVSQIESQAEYSV